MYCQTKSSKSTNSEHVPISPELSHSIHVEQQLLFNGHVEDGSIQTHHIFDRATQAHNLAAFEIQMKDTILCGSQENTVEGARVLIL